MIAGRGCLVGVDDDARGRRVERLGFFTTRFVVATTVDGAVLQATAMVEHELRAIVMNAPDQPYHLEVEEAYEDAQGKEQYGVGAGFTWYPDDL